MKSSATPETTKKQPSLPPRTRWNSPYGIPGLLCIALTVLDQLSKWLIDRFYEPYLDVTVLIPDILNIVHVRNTGAAWGIFAEHTWLLGVLSLACFIVLFCAFDRFTERKTSNALLAGTLAGGIAGNMIDRLFRASVIDFIDVHWQEVYHYPSFNVADMAICVSVVLLIINSFRHGLKQETTA